MARKSNRQTMHEKLTESGRRLANAGFTLREIEPEWKALEADASLSQRSFERPLKLAFGAMALAAFSLLAATYLMGESERSMVGATSNVAKSTVKSSGSETLEASAVNFDMAQVFSMTLAKEHRFKMPWSKDEKANVIERNGSGVRKTWLNSLTKKRRVSFSRLATRLGSLDEFPMFSVRFQLSPTQSR